MADKAAQPFGQRHRYALLVAGLFFAVIAVAGRMAYVRLTRTNISIQAPSRAFDRILALANWDRNMPAPSDLQGIHYEVHGWHEGNHWFEADCGPETMDILKAAILKQAEIKETKVESVDIARDPDPRYKRPNWWNPETMPDAEALHYDVVTLIFSKKAGRIFGFIW